MSSDFDYFGDFDNKDVVKTARDIRDHVGRFMLDKGLHMDDKVDAGKVQDMMAEYVEGLLEALIDANSLCRSAHSIASRKGLQTNWDTFIRKLDKSLELQQKVIHGRWAQQG